METMDEYMSEDYKAKGYHSKSEMRRVEHMKKNECLCGEINARHCPVHGEVKPREWWIRPKSSSVPQIYDRDPGRTKFKIKDVVHVIEYSAYLSEKERADRLEAENKRLALGHYRDDHRFHPLKQIVDRLEGELAIAKEALEEIMENSPRIVNLDLANNWTRWAQRRAAEALKELDE